MDPYNIKIKNYENGEIMTVTHDNHVIYSKENTRRITNRVNTDNRDKSIYRSLARSKNTIYDLSKSADWQYFITLTFSDKKVSSRYDYVDLIKRISIWINNIKTRYSPDLKYLIVPDFHKQDESGHKALHFHGLISDVGNLQMEDSGKKDKTGRTIYNLKNYTLGFSTATKVMDTKRVSAYITKYMTKELGSITFNKKRYLCSKNISRPNV